MRGLALAVLGACSFSPGTLAGDAANGDDDARDAPGTDDPDAPPDMAIASPLRVRSIDLTDGLVTGAPHANFPLLVSLAAQGWLRSTTNGGEVARVDGFDIYFSADQAGVTRLAHEVEVYAPLTGDLVAWVSVPVLVPETVIYMHYGDPAITTSQENVAQVWSANYELVHHIDGGGDATTKNATVDTALVQVTGKIGRARTFDGATSNIAAGSLAVVDDIFAGGGTIEGWFYATGFGENGFGRVFDKGLTNGYALYIDDTNRSDTVSLMVGCSDGIGQGLWMMPSAANILNNWHHVAVVYNKDSAANDPIFYFDGASVTVTEFDTPSGTIDSDAAEELMVGNNPALSRTFDGSLDELRMSSVTRTDGWIVTQYRNQDNPGTFYALSAPL